MNEQLKAFLEEKGINYECDADLSALTSFHTGGQCDMLVNLQNEQEAAALLAFLHQRQIPWFVLGKGSNVLAPDGQVTRLILKWRDDSQPPYLADGLLYCGAGYPLLKLCRFAQKHQLTGLEFAYGIPGSVGGAVFMNAGAYGGEIRDCLVSVKCLDATGNEMTFSAEEAKLGYRDSMFQHQNLLICGATFRLQAGDGTAIEAKMQELMSRRKEKQPLEYPSAGSTFKRPEGHFAGGLIEEAGLKGFSVGGAQVSEKHAGFCINFNHATTGDVLALVAEVQKRVQTKSGILLEPEVRLIPKE